MIVISVDPGATTGIARWDTGAKSLLSVDSMMIHEAMAFVARTPADLVLVEDARMRKWFGKSGREKLQGAGSIKRDCSIWEDYLTSMNMRFVLLPPKANKTKLSDPEFRLITKWEGRTNEHARDAAMLVYGMTDAMTQLHLRGTVMAFGQGRRPRSAADQPQAEDYPTARKAPRRKVRARR